MYKRCKAREWKFHEKYFLWTPNNNPSMQCNVHVNLFLIVPGCSFFYCKIYGDIVDIYLLRSGQSLQVSYYLFIIPPPLLCLQISFQRQRACLPLPQDQQRPVRHARQSVAESQMSHPISTEERPRGETQLWRYAASSLATRGKR